MRSINWLTAAALCIGSLLLPSCSSLPFKDGSGLTVMVRDNRGRPLSGAEILMEDGGTWRTGPDGRAEPAVEFPTDDRALICAVEKKGYLTGFLEINPAALPAILPVCLKTSGEVLRESYELALEDRFAEALALIEHYPALSDGIEPCRFFIAVLKIRLGEVREAEEILSQLENYTRESGKLILRIHRDWEEEQ